MPTPITATFPTVNFPKRGELERDAFVSAQENAQDVLSDTWNTAATDFKNQANTLATELNNLVEGQTATQIHSATAKTTPADNDELGLVDSASSWVLKKLTWGNLKTALGSLFVSKVPSTDNAIPRFDGTTGEVQNSGVTIDDAGNVGLSVTPSAWYSTSKAIEIGQSSFYGVTNSTLTGWLSNGYLNSASSSFTYKNNGYASYMQQENGGYKWHTAPSGTAGNAITWNTTMTLQSNGSLLVGTTTDNGVDKLQVNGSISSGSGRMYNVSFIGTGSNGTYITNIPINAYQGGRTINLTASSQYGSGANTSSYIKMIRCQYDGGVFNVVDVAFSGATGDSSTLYITEVNGFIAFGGPLNWTFYITMVLSR